jgi:hypothetical protein
VVAGRRFESQKAFEDYFRSQVGRLPETQRRLTLLEKQLQERDAKIAEFQQALTLRNAAGGQGGTPDGGPPALKEWGDELLESGDLQIMSELAEEKGVGHALYAMANVFGARVDSLIEQAINGYHASQVGPMTARREFDEHMGRVLHAVRELSPNFPELDESNKSPEAEEARQAIIEIWKSYPREYALGDPGRALRHAVRDYRDQHGTPIFAVPPGTSGSPSTRAAQAAERAGAGATVLDGGSTPKPRPDGRPKTPQEELADDLAEVDTHTLRSKEGVSLGVRRIV